MKPTAIDTLDPQVILEDLPREGTAWSLHIYTTLESTNTRAVELAAEGAPEGTVIVADAQERGRGRMGRSWFSPPGANLYASILLRPPFDPREAPKLPLTAGVAAAQAIGKVTHLPVQLKWPNDVIVRDRKVAGILSEIQTNKGRIAHMIVGIGINVNLPEEAFPEDLRGTATSIRTELGRPISRSVLLREILAAVGRWYRTLLHQGFGPIHKEWDALSCLADRPVQIDLLTRPALRGRAGSLDPEGRLLVKLESGKVEAIEAGDVRLLRV